MANEHWKASAAFLRKQLEGARGEADKQPPELRIPHEAGMYRAVAQAALDLLDKFLQETGGAPPAGNLLLVNGRRYPVINDWVEVESPSDGRKRWGIVTEAAEEQPPRADATAPTADVTAPKEDAQHYIERPSGSPFRVDGPGCTPLGYVPNEAGEVVRAGSLYANKCEECTTGISCEEAGRCLFEG